MSISGKFLIIWQSMRVLMYSLPRNQRDKTFDFKLVLIAKKNPLFLLCSNAKCMWCLTCIQLTKSSFKNVLCIEDNYKAIFLTYYTVNFGPNWDHFVAKTLWCLTKVKSIVGFSTKGHQKFELHKLIRGVKFERRNKEILQYNHKTLKADFGNSFQD